MDLPRPRLEASPIQFLSWIFLGFVPLSYPIFSQIFLGYAPLRYGCHFGSYCTCFIVLLITWLLLCMCLVEGLPPDCLTVPPNPQNPDKWAGCSPRRLESQAFLFAWWLITVPLAEDAAVLWGVCEAVASQPDQAQPVLLPSLLLIPNWVPTLTLVEVKSTRIGNFDLMLGRGRRCC